MQDGEDHHEDESSSGEEDSSEEQEQKSPSMLKSLQLGPPKLSLSQWAAAHGGRVTAELRRTHADALELPSSQ